MLFPSSVAKDLKAARVSHQWGVPPHESMQSSHLLNQLFPWLQMEVIRVGDNDLATDLVQILDR